MRTLIAFFIVSCLLTSANADPLLEAILKENLLLKTGSEDDRKTSVANEINRIYKELSVHLGLIPQSSGAESNSIEIAERLGGSVRFIRRIDQLPYPFISQIRERFHRMALSLLSYSPLTNDDFLASLLLMESSFEILRASKNADPKMVDMVSELAASTIVQVPYVLEDLYGLGGDRLDDYRDLFVERYVANVQSLPKEIQEKLSTKLELILKAQHKRTRNGFVRLYSGNYILRLLLWQGFPLAPYVLGAPWPLAVAAHGFYVVGLSKLFVQTSVQDIQAYFRQLNSVRALVRHCQKSGRMSARTLGSSGQK